MREDDARRELAISMRISPDASLLEVLQAARYNRTDSRLK